MPLSWHQRTFDNRLDIDLALAQSTVSVGSSIPTIVKQGVT